MSNEPVEVKVAKLETKVDMVLKDVGEIKATLNEIKNVYVKREEFNEFKRDFNRKQTQKTLLSAILTFVITALLSYLIVDILGR